MTKNAHQPPKHSRATSASPMRPRQISLLLPARWQGKSSGTFMEYENNLKQRVDIHIQNYPNMPDSLHQHVQKTALLQGFNSSKIHCRVVAKDFQPQLVLPKKTHITLLQYFWGSFSMCWWYKWRAPSSISCTKSAKHLRHYGWNLWHAKRKLYVCKCLYINPPKVRHSHWKVIIPERIVFQPSFLKSLC